MNSSKRSSLGEQDTGPTNIDITPTIDNNNNNNDIEAANVVEETNDTAATAATAEEEETPVVVVVEDEEFCNEYDDGSDNDEVVHIDNHDKAVISSPDLENADEIVGTRGSVHDTPAVAEEWRNENDTEEANIAANTEPTEDAVITNNNNNSRKTPQENVAAAAANTTTQQESNEGARLRGNNIEDEIYAAVAAAVPAPASLVRTVTGSSVGSGSTTRHPARNRSRNNSVVNRRGSTNTVIAEPFNDNSNRQWDEEDSCFFNMPVIAISDQQEQIVPRKATDATIAPATTIEFASNSQRSRAVRVDVEAHLVRSASDFTETLRSGHFDDDPYNVGRGGNLDDDDDDALSEDQVRTAQFISARVIRRNPNDDLGFKIRQVDSKTLVISEVKQNGLLAQTPILNGDKLLSINNKSCLGMKAPGVIKLLQNTTQDQHVTITVQNERGDGSLIECYVEKPDQKTKIGIDLNGRGYHRNLGFRQSLQSAAPIVSSIDPGGLMEDSLLQSGHTIISINGRKVWNTKSVAKYLARAKNHVTILAKTSDGGAAVVTTEPERGTRSRIFDFYGTPAPALRIRGPGQSDESNIYDSVRISCNLAGLALAVVALMTPAKQGFPTQNWIFFTIMIIILVNAPWQCRKPGSRFSLLQIGSNLFVLSIILVQALDSSIVVKASWFCAFYIPLFIVMNLPSFFPGEGDSEDDEL